MLSLEEIAAFVVIKIARHFTGPHGFTPLAACRRCFLKEMGQQPLRRPPPVAASLLLHDSTLQHNLDELAERQQHAVGTLHTAR